MSSENKHIAPGSANWINKYFNLVQKGSIQLKTFQSLNEDEEIFDLIICRSGLLFGKTETFIFSRHIDLGKLTANEALKLLFFEALLLTHLQFEESFDPSTFLSDLHTFYGNLNQESWKLNLSKKDKAANVEETINKRITVKSGLLDSNFWLNSIGNILCIVDVILFEEFKAKKISSLKDSYEIYNYKLIRGIILAAKIDNKLEKKERKMIDRFLASSNLSQMYLTDLNTLLHKDHLSQEDFSLEFPSKRLAKVTFIFSLYITEGTHATTLQEKEDLRELGAQWGLSQEEMKECKTYCNSYLFAKTKNDFSKPLPNEYKDFTTKWIRILGRNKDKFVTELKESKELIALIKKSTKEDLSKEEKEKVKSQFMEILKSMPSIGIFLLPGGAILLPLILKIVPDLLPSAFRENQTEES